MLKVDWTEYDQEPLFLIKNYNKESTGHPKVYNSWLFISGSSNGRIAEFDSVDIGPNPVPEAIFLLDNN